MEEDVNWDVYFEIIRNVCPWSYSSWQRGLIDIVEWQGNWSELGGYDARIYTVALNRRRLKKLCAKLDESIEYEWLWSEPRYGKFASPIPILIQQHRAKLEKIREKLK